MRKSVPPYIRAAREPLSYVGVNKVGLQRRNFTTEQINRIHDIYRIMFVKGYNMTNALEIVDSSIEASEEKRNILEFIRSTDRGILRGFNQLNGSELYED